MDDESVIQYERSLGKGAYGSVFLIRNELNGERYALKRIDFQGNEEECVQARREAEILSKLSHENVLKYIESFEDEDTLNIVTEFCEGGDLEDYLRQRKGKQLAEQHIILWIQQVMSGLQYIHEKKILHRDLKTKNLFLTENLNIKVGDLGIAKVLEGEKAKAMTFVGTLTYMSPEQFQHQPYNHKADIWSFGCCAYEMVALRRAFSKPSLFHNVQDIQNGKLPAFPSGYTESLKDLVFSMLKTNPKHRPSATKLLQHDLLQDATSWRIQDVVVLSEMESKGKPNKSARLRRRKDVAQGKYAKPDIRMSMSWKDIRMEIDKHEQEVLSNVIDKLAQVTLQNSASGFMDDTMRVNESEENSTMRVNQTGTGDYDDTMRVNRTGTGDYDDTMRVSRTGTGNYDDTMRVNQTGTGYYDETMRVNQTGTGDYVDTMRVNQSFSGDYDNTMRVNSTYEGDYDDTMRVNNTGTSKYRETLEENESNDYDDTFVTARSGNDTINTFLSDDFEEFYDASQSLSSTVATELETLLRTSSDSLSSLKINMVSKDLLEKQGPDGEAMKGKEEEVLASLEGTIDFSRNPIAAARTIVEGLKKNLTPFEGSDEVETAPPQTNSSSPDGGKKKRKKASFLAKKVERKKSETTSPVGSLTFPDSEKATFKNVKEGSDMPAAETIPKEEEEEPVVMRPKRARSRRYGRDPFDRRKTTDSIRGILAIMSVPENKDICDDQAAFLRREIVNDLGKDILDKCFDLMSSIQDDNILQVVLQDLIGPRKYEEYRMHLFLLRMFELNSIASY